ncbi:restriction endonuclease subunit S [Elizabethkingia anophelis]|nr:restriction endonuclease subunit S [Elizabethkingia anophelis]
MTEENKNVKKFPNLRFPGFEGEWEVKILSDLGTFSGGGTPTSSNEKFWNGNIPWISSSDLQEDNIFKINISRFITQDAIEKSSTKLCKAPSVLIVSRVGVGKVALSLNDVCTSQDFTNISELKCNQLYLAFQLSKVMKKAANEVQGTSIKGISSSEIKSKKIYLPPIIEQEKISSFIEKIDKRIQTQRKIIEDLQITKKEISLKLFKDGFNTSESKKENFQKLGDITYVVNKKNKGNLKLPIYSINNKKGFISQSEQFEGIDSDERGYDISLYKIIEKETFAYNPARINVGSIGYSRNLENIIISSLYVCFKTTDAVDDEFLFHYLRTDIFRKEVLRSVEGGVRDYLFYENFSRIKINLPDLEEQIKIAHFLSKFDEKINLESDLLAQYEHQKKYLLQNLFV